MSSHGRQDAAGPAAELLQARDGGVRHRHHPDHPLPRGGARRGRLVRPLPHGGLGCDDQTQGVVPAQGDNFTV